MEKVNVTPVGIENDDDNVTSVSHRKKDENVTPVSHEKKDDKAGAANHATASHQTEAKQRKDKADKDYKTVMALASFLRSVGPDSLRGGCCDGGDIRKMLEKKREQKKADELMKNKILEIKGELKKADELMKNKEKEKEEKDQGIKTNDEEIMRIMCIENTEEQNKTDKTLQDIDEVITKKGQEQQKNFVERQTICDKITKIINEKMEIGKEIMKKEKIKEAWNTELKMSGDKERKRIFDEVEKTDKETMTLFNEIKQKDEEMKQYDEQMKKIDNERVNIKKEIDTKTEEQRRIMDGRKSIVEKIKKIERETTKLNSERNQLVNEIKVINEKINKLNDQLNTIGRK